MIYDTNMARCFPDYYMIITKNKHIPIHITNHNIKAKQNLFFLECRFNT